MSVAAKGCYWCRALATWPGPFLKANQIGLAAPAIGLAAIGAGTASGSLTATNIPFKGIAIAIAITIAIAIAMFLIFSHKCSKLGLIQFLGHL